MIFTDRNKFVSLIKIIISDKNQSIKNNFLSIKNNQLEHASTIQSVSFTLPQRVVVSFLANRTTLTEAETMMPKWLKVIRNNLLMKKLRINQQF